MYLYVSIIQCVQRASLKHWQHTLCILYYNIIYTRAAAGGFIYTITILQAKNYNVKETILRACDVITIIVPPALPAALTVGTVYALSRLRKQKIYCISPQRLASAEGAVLETDETIDLFIEWALMHSTCSGQYL